MMKLAPGTLRLTAVYGFVISVTVMCFGASVGNWIDKTRRIKGLQSSKVLSFSLNQTLFYFIFVYDFHHLILKLQGHFWQFAIFVDHYVQLV